VSMKRNRSTVFWTVLGLLWLIFIWGNSLQTAAESSQRSRGILALLLPLLSGLGIPEELMHTLLRKLAHMAEFGILGILWSLAILPGDGRLLKKMGLCLAICLSAAAVDETVQLFVPGRSGELLDVCIDLTGSILGVAFVTVLMRVFGKKKKLLEE